MFSSLKKKDDEYKHNKIKYPILGLILGTTMGYYAPFVFLFTKFLSATAMGSFGTYTGSYLNDKELEECHYKKCAFDTYETSVNNFSIKDHLFRDHIIQYNDFNINYSLKHLENNKNSSEHIISKCYNDMIDYFNKNYKEDLNKNTKKFLSFFFLSYM